MATVNPDPELLTTILAALKRQKRTQQWTKEDGQYIPEAHKWLREKRWTDEGVQAPSPSVDPTRIQEKQQQRRKDLDQQRQAGPRKPVFGGRGKGDVPCLN